MLTQEILRRHNIEICVNNYWHDQNTLTAIVLPGLNLCKTGPFFLLSKIAKRCHEKKINVIQFDYYGEGDSSGTYIDVSYNTLIQSVEIVIDYAKNKGCSKFILIGYGIGNLLTSHFCTLNEIIGIVLIAPNFKMFDNPIKHDLSNKMSDQDHVWVELSNQNDFIYWRSLIGATPWLYYTPVSNALLTEISSIDVKNQLRLFSGKVLIVDLSDCTLDKNCLFDELDVQIINIRILDNYDKNAWIKWKQWPNKWDEISLTISSWLNSNFMTENAFVNISTLSQSNKKKIVKNSISYAKESKRYSFEFQADGKKILGILHVPAKDFISNQKRPCIIYEPGLGGSRVDINRCGPWLGDYLAKNGYFVLRYDSSGSGDSEGEFYESSWTSRYYDFTNSLDALSKITEIDMENVGIVSYSAGAKLACMAANRLPNIKGCVLWAPDILTSISNENTFGPQFTRNHLGHFVSPLCGLWLGIAYFKEYKRYDFAYEFANCPKPLVIMLGNMEEKNSNSLFLEEMTLKDTRKTMLKFDGYHHFHYQSMDAVICSTLDNFNSIFKRKSKHANLIQ